MKRVLRMAIFAALVAAVALPGATFAAGPAADSAPQTYNVLVGYENTRQAYDIMSFFPNVVTIHVGDTVHWKINSKELHTVTFLAGSSLPDLIVPSATVGGDPSISPILLNPLAADKAVPAGGMYDGSTYANSGLMGYESWEYQDFNLTFTKAGTYDYVCIVHGTMMSGKVVVEGPEVRVPSPGQSTALGHKQLAEQLAKVPAVMRAAKAQAMPDELNPDGSATHFITLGYMDGQIDVMGFFPNQVKVKPGDTVVWAMSPNNFAPHTVTFLNGAPDPELAIPSGSLLYADPGTFFPSGSGTELTRSGVFNSGVVEPTPGQFTEFYSLKIGDMSPGLLPYVCLLHDESGMRGSLMVTSEDHTRHGSGVLEEIRE